MSSFTTRLIMEPQEDGRTWRLVEPFTYDVGELGGADTITVPKDFFTDFASVPRIFWRVFPPWGTYGKAAVLHDWLYSVQDRPRLECDQIFLEAMEVLGVGWLSRKTIYRCVRLGGWIAWKTHAKENQKSREEENVGNTEKDSDSKKVA
jgi:hypothetical protein